MWDIRHRPLTFADVLGQPGTVEVLRKRLRNGTAMDTSYIFSGAHGSGKTTLARILARAILCQNLNRDEPDPCNACDNCKDFLSESSRAFQEMDAASKGTIDNVRSLVDDLAFAVMGADKRIYLFDEAHRMSRDSQDVLLKPIEDKRLVGIFCTTEPEKIRGPIRSRCEEYSIRKATREDILLRMQMVLKKEGVESQEDAVLTIIDYCGGHVRDVLNRLEMVSQMGPVTAEAVREYLNLSLTSCFFEVLLLLDEPAKAVPMVEAACERVSPDEVSAGLAEAAMNSYRLAHGMFANFVWMDRELAKKVYEKYRDGLPRLAEHFLRSKRSSRVGLICDVLMALSTPSRASLPPPAPVMLSPVMQAPVVQTQAAQAPVAGTVPPAVVPAQFAAPVPSPAPPVELNDKGLRADGVGDLGSSDVGALTGLDTKFVSHVMPRHPDNMSRSNTVSDGPLDEFQPISPDAWTREFRRYWTWSN